MKLTDSQFIMALELCLEKAFTNEFELDQLLINQGYDPQKDIDEGLEFIQQLLKRKEISSEKLSYCRI